MTKRLYLMRHGETLFNVLRLTQGWADSPLTENGMEVCRATGAKLASLGIDPDHFYCSTSERCSDTLELVMQGMYGEGEIRPYERCKGIKEFNRGRFEGEPLYLIFQRMRPLGMPGRDMPDSAMKTGSFSGPRPTPEQERKQDEFIVAFGGEGNAEVVERMTATLDSIMSREDNQVVHAVSHGDCGRLFMRSTGVTEEQEGGHVLNCTTFVYDYESGENGERGTFTFVERIEPADALD